MPTDNSLFEILVIDDDPSICDLLCLIGRKEFTEATFTSIATPQSTLDYLLTSPKPCPRLVLLDLDLRQAMDGFGLLPHLQEHFQGQAPIIILTGMLDKQHVPHAYQAGAVAFTQKPTELQEWKTYLAQLKDYWFSTVALPQLN